MPSEEKKNGKWQTARLVIGILLMVLFAVVSLQSCAVGLGNAITNNGEVSGSFGFLSSLAMLVAGIVGVATRKSASKGGPITACAFCWIVFFFSRIGSGSFRDLRVWGLIAFGFGCFFLFSGMTSKKGNMIAAIVSVIYFLLGIA